MQLGTSNKNGNNPKPSDNHLETENEQMVSSLSSKVSQLKYIAVDIESEAKYQNKLQLGSMEDDFESLKQYMGSSFTRVTNLVASGSNNRRLMCYLIVALVGAFFLCYYILGRFSR